MLLDPIIAFLAVVALGYIAWWWMDSNWRKY
jgi:hypothetical protein